MIGRERAHIRNRSPWDRRKRLNPVAIASSIHIKQFETDVFRHLVLEHFQEEKKEHSESREL